MDTVFYSSTEEFLNGHACDTAPFTLKDTIMISFMSVHSFLVASANLLNTEERNFCQLSLSFLMTSGREIKSFKFLLFLVKI